MAITNLTNTRWQFNETLDHYNIGDLNVYQYSPDHVVAVRENKFNINFIYADEQYTSLSYKFYLDSPEASKVSANSTQIWAGGSWYNADENDHIMTITDGDDVADPDLIAWLEANATQLDVDNPVDPDPGDDGSDPDPGPGDDGGDDGKPVSATFDLSTLNLPAGTHTVYVTLSAEGYRDSEPSNVVEYKITEKVEEITPYLTFSSPSSFTLKTNNSYKNWDGTLEYSTDTSTWDVWDGKTTLSADDGKLYLRGTGNTKITGSATYVYPQKYWILTGENISCDGNIETLLDYETVINGQHPIMSDYCYTLLFNKCEGLISAPELPATTLTQYCYSYMFDGCTRLTTIPALPATTLADYCYYYMFNKCTNIKISTTQTSEYNHEYRIPTNDTGTTANQALLSMFSSTGGTFTYTPSINTTYYTSNTVVY